MLPFRGASRVRYRRPRRHGGQGIARARARGGEKLRREVSRLPHHGESCSGGAQERRNALRSADPSRYSRLCRGDQVSRQGRGLCRRAFAHRHTARGERRAAHGDGRGARRHQNALCPRGQRRRGNACRRRDRLRRAGRCVPCAAFEGQSAAQARAEVAGGADERDRPRLFRRHGAGECQARIGDRRRGRAQHPAHRLARRGQVDAGAKASVDPARYDEEGSARGDGNLVSRGADGQCAADAAAPALPCAAPHALRFRDDRRGKGAEARRNFARASRRSLFR